MRISEYIIVVYASSIARVCAQLVGHLDHACTNEEGNNVRVVGWGCDIGQAGTVLIFFFHPSLNESPCAIISSDLPQMLVCSHKSMHAHI